MQSIPDSELNWQGGLEMQVQQLVFVMEVHLAIVMWIQ